MPRVASSIIVLVFACLAGCSAGNTARMTPELAGSGTSTSDRTAKNLYVADLSSVTIYAPGSDSILRSISSLSPSALAFNSSSNLFVANVPVGERGDVKVFRAGEPPPLRTITTGVDEPRVLAFDAVGNLYVANSYFEVAVYPPGSSSPSRYLKAFYSAAVIFDHSGNTYVASDPSPYGGRGGSKILVYSPRGTLLRTITSGLEGPIALAFSEGGYLFAANYNGNDVTVYAPGKTSVVRRISAGIRGPDRLLFDRSGNLYVANNIASDVTVYAPRKSTALRTIREGISHPATMAFDSSWNLYVANSKSVTEYGPGGSSPMLTITNGIRSPIALGFGP